MGGDEILSVDNGRVVPMPFGGTEDRNIASPKERRSMRDDGTFSVSIVSVYRDSFSRA